MSRMIKSHAERHVEPLSISPEPRLSPETETETDQSTSTLDQVEALRRQVTALQRISSLGILAGGVFHELNNALTPILNYAKLGLRNPDPDYRERALKRILEGAQRATTITGSMLGLSRPGRDPNHREPVDLGRLVEDVLRLVGKDLTRNRARLDLQIASRPFARVNAIQIQQVLINLLINARQAMPEGGVLRLRLAVDPSGRMVELSVADQGVGIAPEHLRSIFEPFFSTKTGPDAAGLGGTGLGLAVCRDIVEAHHGRIRAESRRGQGSTFTLLLPACPPPSDLDASTQAGAA
ncbi:sensor histidine kinase [Planctomyces sp. SH-PL62]|uniref:sensor histidine kinase n=1 Tax=Planctomyces sp. SH-PL62 TaxID=1636152 RepID=UPI00078C4D57|nr:ATP-binding protein [Planctomyces sp. SH-PL62]AMV38857.1 Sensor protein ZraS [Planctomyces sp. SH-PL62]